MTSKRTTRIPCETPRCTGNLRIERSPDSPVILCPKCLFCEDLALFVARAALQVSR